MTYRASGKTVLTSNQEPARPHFFAVSEVVQFIGFIVGEHCSHVLTLNQLYVVVTGRKSAFSIFHNDNVSHSYMHVDVQLCMYYIQFIL